MATAIRLIGVLLATAIGCGSVSTKGDDAGAGGAAGAGSGAGGQAGVGAKGGSSGGTGGATSTGNAGSGPDGGEVALATMFSGQWTYAGTLVPSCSGFQADPFDLTGDTVSITATAPDRIRAVIGASCTLVYTVTGSVATADAGQNCSVDSGTSLGSVSVSVSSWTLTLGSDGHLASQMSGTIPSFSCTVSGTGTLTR